MYRSALRLRAQHLKGDEDLEWLDSTKDVLSFRRGSGVVCIVNFGTKPVKLPDGKLLIASQPDVSTDLPSDTTAWLVPEAD